MSIQEIKLLSALFDIAEINIDYLSYEGQTKFNYLSDKIEKENIIW